MSQPTSLLQAMEAAVAAMDASLAWEAALALTPEQEAAAVAVRQQRRDATAQLERHIKAERVWAGRPQDSMARMAAANELIRVISTCGRRFFHHGFKSGWSQFVRDPDLCFLDDFKGGKCYPLKGDMNKSSHGSGLKFFITALAKYIQDGDSATISAVLKHNHWGYDDDMAKVRDAAVQLGMIRAVHPQ